MIQWFNRGLLLALLGLISASGLLGCANLKAVKEFAATSATITDNHGPVKELSQTYDRRRVLIGDTELWCVTIGEPIDLKETLAATEEDQKLAGETLKGFNAAEKTLTDYMGALGQLANDDLVKVDDPADSLAKSLKASKYLPDDKVDAIKSLVGVLGRAMTDHWRKAELEQLIHTANPHFQNVCGALEAIAVSAVGGSLRDERELTDQYYKSALSNVRHRLDAARKAAGHHDGAHGGGAGTQGSTTRDSEVLLVYEPAIVILLLDERRAALGAIDAKIAAVTAYAEAVKQVAKGHQTLWDNLSRLESAEVIAEIKQLTSDLKAISDDIKSLRKAK